MARTVVRLAEDQSRNVMFSLDEPRSAINYALLLPTISFTIEEIGQERLLLIPAHGLSEGQEVAVDAAGPRDKLPAGLEAHVQYFVTLKGPDHVGLATIAGRAVPIYSDGNGALLMFAWVDGDHVCRLPPIATGKPIVRAAGEMLLRGLLRHHEVARTFSTARSEKTGSSPICLFFGDATRRVVESFPWEAMYDEDEQFLALTQKWPIIRLKDPQSSVVETFAYDPPLRIFAVLSATGPNVDATPEWEGLYQAVQHLDVVVRVLTCQSALVKTINGLGNWRFSAGQTQDGENVLHEFREFTPQVLHLFGHGDVAKGELVFGNLDDFKQNKRGSVTVSAAAVRQYSSEALPVWITILNACRSAEATDGPESLASALSRSGFPVVIGMSTEVASQNAEVFTRTYYRSIMQLLNGCEEWTPHVVDWASRLWETRVAIQARCTLGPEMCPTWTIPLFYTRIQPFELLRVGKDNVERTSPASLDRLIRAQALLNSDQLKVLGIKGLRDVLA